MAKPKKDALEPASKPKADEVRVLGGDLQHALISDQEHGVVKIRKAPGRVVKCNAAPNVAACVKYVRGAIDAKGQLVNAWVFRPAYAGLGWEIVDVEPGKPNAEPDYTDERRDAVEKFRAAERAANEKKAG